MVKGKPKVKKSKKPKPETSEKVKEKKSITLEKKRQELPEKQTAKPKYTTYVKRTKKSHKVYKKGV